jgi:hypothetical protein
MNSPESQTSPANREPSLRYPVCRDGWDAVDYYLAFFIGSQGIGLFMIANNLVPIGQPSSARWCFLVLGVIYFVVGLIGIVARTWRRYCEEYELTETEFIHHLGYLRKRAPLSEISRAHSIRIFRSTIVNILRPKLGPRQGLRIEFRKPDAKGSGHGGKIEIDVPGYKGARPIVDAWKIDICPINLEGFLDDLAARCPHLEWKGMTFSQDAVDDREA